ncbi:LptF/LptG family permease [Mucilaginibacter sp.]|uniref:LptF/LptG family permease n=1 Tax=Mucilaginibacter sp. TaxID=1882438 RepID=UPI00262708A7|nr:LptF/LptG family permease [Mucilaginibacter sp.]
MKKIHLLLLKSFIRPFLVTFLIVMFVLLMLFLWKYIDDLIGKGFEWYIIVELMVYASATNVQMALPLSVLLSSIMTYGSLGENYELVAIKSAGISLNRAMYPMFVVVLVLSISAFIFSDYMLPVANLKYFSLLYDAREQKSANFLPEGVFSNSFPGYTIRVMHKDPDGQTLYDITIYHKDISTNESYLLFAKKGKMFRSSDDQYLVMQLEDGIKYQEDPGGPTYSPNPRQKLTRFRFKSTENKLDMSGFKLHRTNESEFKTAFQMMNIKQLRDTMGHINHLIDSGRRVNYSLVTPYIKYFFMPAKHAKSNYIKYKQGVLKTGSNTDRLSYIVNAQSEVRSVQDLIKTRDERYKDASGSVHSAAVEYQKKYTLSAACLALFLIGAPLGAIIRKGGLGLPVVVSVIFFLIYYIISTIGEKAVKAGDASPFIGMWIAIIILTPIGIFLSYKAATDSVIFDAEIYKRFFNNLFGSIKRLVIKD